MNTFDILAAEAKKRTLVMGILNLTPDSFFAGSRVPDPGAALERAAEMARQGADLLDLGGQSTRPGAARVDAKEEMERVLSVARRLAKELPGVAWSIDTQHVETARAALDLGACLVNDVSALRGEGGLESLVAGAGCGLCLMHWPDPSGALTVSTKETQQYGPAGVMKSVKDWLLAAAEKAVKSGILRGRVWIDPGFGFGKSVPDNLALLKGLNHFTGTGFGVLLGTSRKSTLGAVLDNLGPEERLEATLATTALAAWMGAACVRVHDVKENVRVVRTVAAIRNAT